jgi:hypothetical protein
MKKKTAFTGMLAAVFALVVIGCLAAQAGSISPPQGFVGTWHTEMSDGSSSLKTFIVIEIGADGSILMRGKMFDGYDRDITADAIRLSKEEYSAEQMRFFTGTVYRVTKVDSPSKIRITGPESGGTGTWELIGQSMMVNGTVYEKGGPRL